MPLSNDQVEEMKRKREKIMKVATNLFSINGYDNVPISRIAKEAGVSYGNIFTYFESKDQLFFSIISEPLMEFKEKVLSFSIEPVNPLDEIRAMVKYHLQLYASQEDYLRLVQQVIGQYSRFTKEFKLLDEFHRDFKNKLMELISKGQAMNQLIYLDSELVAITYTSFLLGLRLNLTDSPDDPIWATFIPNAVQIFGPVNK